MQAENYIESVYPLSYMQEGMLFLALRLPGSGITTEQIICDLHERVNVEALRKAWQKIIERHSVLRTSLHWQGYRNPIQKVHHQVEMPWKFIDWSELSDDEQNAQFLAFLEDDCRLGFDFAEPPLMRLTLIRLRENDYRLIWSVDHVLLDGRSFSIILSEVFTLYEAIREGRSLELKIPQPYEEYVRWLRARNLKHDEAFWREELKGFSAPTPICPYRCDENRANEGLIGAEVETRLSLEMTRRLIDLARDNDLGLSTIIQGAWAILLSLFSKNEEVVFGVVRSGRKTLFGNAASMVGLFINTIPLRVKILANLPIISWLKQLRHHQVSLRDYELSPLIEIQKWSEVPPGSPLFESIIVFENYDLNSKIKLQPGNWMHREFKLIELSKYPITLYALGGEQLNLKIGYQKSRCDEESARRLLNYLKKIIEIISEGPYQHLNDLCLLTEDDQKKYLEWSKTFRPLPEGATIHQLVEAQAEKTPEAVALLFEDQNLKYQELNKKANQLARHLRKLGVRPEDLVGICVERSFVMFIGLLGILKAGGAYLPLDPTYPPERLHFMLSDSRASVLLTQARFLNLFSEYKGNIVILDRDWNLIDKESGYNFQSGVRSENLAYVIYTSGSTGRPKGVMIEHRNVINFFTGMDEVIGKEEGGTWLAVTSISFDISVLEVFWTLCRGFRIVIYSGERKFFKEKNHEDHSISQLIKRHQVTHIQCTPSMANMLLMDEESREALSSLKKILIGGEAFPLSLAEELLKISSAEIFNLYGPTETTVWSTVFRVNRHEHGTIPIGRPLANTYIYIVDEKFRQTPLGVPGEILIGGRGVARGYLNNPELTAERFIKNPFTNSNDRLYRTGDLGRYLRDGNIEFLGRIDNQIKIRGYRVEPNEIECVLCKHPNVKDVVVTAREDMFGQKRIVAYVIPKDEHLFRLDEIRAYAANKLPEFMVPAQIIKLKELPKTPNNKIDRKALNSSENEQFEYRTNFEPPITEIEEALAQIWAEALGLEKVGRNENFFSLGGDSLTACGIILNIRRACNIDLPLQSIFSSPTVAALSKKLEEAFQKQASSWENLTIKRTETHYQPPQTPTEKTLAAIWAKILHIDRVGRNHNFFEIGGKSIDAVKLFAEIEREFGKKLPLSTLLQAPTISQLALLIKDEKWKPNWSPLVPIQTNGCKPPFFCVHGHRGNVLNYYPLAHYLGPDQPFYGLQARGLNGEDIGFRTFEDMASEYLNEIKAVQNEGPYILGGWCMGGYIALEMARLLKDETKEPVILVLIDTPHPSYLKLLTNNGIFYRLINKILDRADYEMNVFRAINNEDKIPHIRNKLKAAIHLIQVFAEGSILELFNKIRLKFPYSQAYRLKSLYSLHDMAFKLYNPRPYQGRIVLFRSSKQPRGIGQDPTLGWRDFFGGEVEFREIPGHYINILVEPSIKILAQKLKNLLESIIN